MFSSSCLSISQRKYTLLSWLQTERETLCCSAFLHVLFQSCPVSSLSAGLQRHTFTQVLYSTALVTLQFTTKYIKIYKIVPVKLKWLVFFIDWLTENDLSAFLILQKHLKMWRFAEKLNMRKLNSVLFKTSSSIKIDLFCSFIYEFCICSVEFGATGQIYIYATCKRCSLHLMHYEVPPAFNSSSYPRCLILNCAHSSALLAFSLVPVSFYSVFCLTAEMISSCGTKWFKLNRIFITTVLAFNEMPSDTFSPNTVNYKKNSCI